MSKERRVIIMFRIKMNFFLDNALSHYLLFIQITPKSIVSELLLKTLLTSMRVSMLVMEPPPAIIFLAVMLVNLELRSAMEPSSLRSGWSGQDEVTLEAVSSAVS